MALQAKLTEKQLKKAAKHLQNELNMPSRVNKPVTYAWLLESLSQGLYGKPYGAVKAMLFSGQDSVQSVMKVSGVYLDISIDCLVSDHELDEEDMEVPDTVRVLVNEPVLEHLLADAALDILHREIPISCLEDFELTVWRDGEPLVPNQEHDSGSLSGVGKIVDSGYQVSRDAEPDTAINKASSVLLLSYGSETVLTLNGQYVCSQGPGSDMEIPFAALSAQAVSLANQHGCTVSQVELPELLGEDWEIDDVLELAGKLGYFRYEKPFVHLLSGTPLTVIYDGVAQVESLDDDHMDAIRCDIDSGEPWRDVFERKLVWSPDFSKGFTSCELFFSYGELGRAEEIRPNVWRVTARHSGQTFEYDFEVIVRH